MVPCIEGPAGRRRIDAISPEIAEFHRIDEHIDRALRSSEAKALADGPGCPLCPDCVAKVESCRALRESRIGQFSLPH
jgi:hypothetical protein